MVRIGIDLGGTSIKAAVVNEQYEIVASGTRPTAMPRPNAAILDDMAGLARDVLQQSGYTMEDVELVGVGSPGTCEWKTGMVEYACNLDFDNLPLGPEMEKRLGKKVLIENDANAAAFGEYLAGAAKGCKSVVCVTIGTGIGSGILFDGKIYTGCNYAGAELGHIVIEKDGLPCNCGRRGCFEQYASATALIRRTEAAMKKRPDSLLSRFAKDGVDGRTSFLANEAGDPVAGELIAQYLRYLTCGLTNIINIFQPELLCIGGGVSNEGEILLSPLRLFIAEQRYSKYSIRQTRLCVAKLGNRAGMIGAAFLDRARLGG
ncbi:MAG: ROK family protein [Clostridia bacterium]|nr:ROK family protein [Clostridia bacterium]